MNEYLELMSHYNLLGTVFRRTGCIGEEKNTEIISVIAVLSETN